MRHHAEARGLALTLDSAGTGGWHAGEAPDPRSIQTCRKYGVDIADQRARQIVAEDFRRFDLILALDGANLMQLQHMVPPDLEDKIRLFGDYAGIGGVADPYYGDLDGFEECWTEIDRAAIAFLDALQSGQV